MNNLTAVEWLIQNIVEDQIIKAKSMSEWTTIYEQARQMEKQQIIDAVDDPKYMESHKTPSTIPGIDSHSMGWFMNGRQYYEINYGGNNE